MDRGGGNASGGGNGGPFSRPNRAPTPPPGGHPSGSSKPAGAAAGHHAGVLIAGPHAHAPAGAAAHAGGPPSGSSAGPSAAIAKREEAPRLAGRAAATPEPPSELEGGAPAPARHEEPAGAAAPPASPWAAAGGKTPAPPPRAASPAPGPRPAALARPGSPAPAAAETPVRRVGSLGSHLARSLLEIGISDFLCVPGDYNLALLDEMIAEPPLEGAPRPPPGQPGGLRMVNCANELNAGYAADGYARARGAACVVVTFMVGSLSLINAVAGAYADNLPLIVVSGSPNNNDYASSRLLHHTLGNGDLSVPMRCFATVTAFQTCIRDPAQAAMQIDEAISVALTKRKPVYLEVAANIAAAPLLAHSHNLRWTLSVPHKSTLMCRGSDPRLLSAAVGAAARFLNGAVRPVLVAGVLLRASNARAEFLQLAERLGCAVAVMPNAKSFFPEGHPQFIGTYWGQVSSAYACETVESSDAYLFAGADFSDYTSVGYSTMIRKSRAILVSEDHVAIGTVGQFACIEMRDFLRELAACDALRPNATSIEGFKRGFVPLAELPPAQEGTPLLNKQLVQCLQKAVAGGPGDHQDGGKLDLVVDCGDAWFISQKLRLLDGASYEIQMTYGSIGWSVGAALGVAMARAGEGRRTLCLVGDGAFQMTMQELATMVRFRLNPIILILNNFGYTIEVEIHDGPYNVITGMEYAKLAHVFDPAGEAAWGVRVSSEKELTEALQRAMQDTRRLAIVEMVINRDDCSAELLEWGARVAAANTRTSTLGLISQDYSGV